MSVTLFFPKELSDDRLLDRWHPSDVGVLNSPKAITKIERVFSKTPFDFNFYISLNHNKRGISTTINPEKYIQDNFGVELNNHAVNVLYTLNGVADIKRDMPISAWTLAHRIIHCLQIYRDHDGNRGGKSLLVEHVFCSNLNKIMDELGFEYHYSQDRFLDYYSFKNNSPWELASALMTMRSARKNILKNSLDFGGEFIAQYLICGKILLNDIDTALPVYISRNGDRYIAGYKDNPRIKDFDAQKINNLLKLMEQEIERAVADTMRWATGRIIFF